MIDMKQYADFLTKDKDWKIIRATELLFNKINKLFIYDNIPDDIPMDVVEGWLHRHGSVIAYRIGDVLEISNNYSGVDLDHYNRPQSFTITINNDTTNNISATKDNSVIIKNTFTMIDLNALFTEYAAFKTEMDITARQFPVLLRSPFIMEAKDTIAYERAIETLKTIVDGDTSVILTDAVNSDDLSMHEMIHPNTGILDFIELDRYKKSEFFSEIGINFNDNGKRTYVSDQELNMQADTTQFLLRDMLHCRMEAVDKINELWGYDIKVMLNPDLFETESGDDEDGNNSDDNDNGDDVNNDDVDGDDSDSNNNGDSSETSDNGEEDDNENEDDDTKLKRGDDDGR